MDEQLSPGKILLRLEELRKWQKIQEERLLEQQMLQRKQLEEAHSKFYETISNSSQYNTLDSSRNDSFANCDLPQETEKRREKLENLSNLMDGVSALNISRESEPILSPVLSSAVESVRSNQSDPKIDDNMLDNPVTICVPKQVRKGTGDEIRMCLNKLENRTESIQQFGFVKDDMSLKKKFDSKMKKNLQINLEEVPIIPKAQDFETLVINNLEMNGGNITEFTENAEVENQNKKRPFLKRGQGMIRFNMSRQDIGLKNETLPWRKNMNNNIASKRKNKTLQNDKELLKTKLEKDKRNLENNIKDTVVFNIPDIKIDTNKTKKKLQYCHKEEKTLEESYESSDQSCHNSEPSDDSRSNLTGEIVELLKSKQSWASVLTQEQEKYIRLLGQTSKYKQYFSTDNSDCSSVASPALNKIKDNKEIAEQRMFEMLEKKVNNSSFSSDSSFIHKVVGGLKGADTPTLNKEYLKAFPHVLNLKPNLSDLKTVEDLYTSQSSVEYCENNNDGGDEIINRRDADTDLEDYTDSTDSEPTCREIINNKGVILTSTPNQVLKESQNTAGVHLSPKDKNKVIKIVISEDTNAADESKSCLDDKTIIQGDESCLGDMTDKAEMLKARLQDLQTEIEVFKRENEAVTQLKATLEDERESFAKEKAEYERKFNEDKIVAEYYLAEEKEKLAKQKALYDRHVKDMKNQSTRKDREEIAVLRKEVNDLKELIKNKDSKNGTAQARLRNQVKFLGKDKEELKFENEKLKKENTRLQNANLRSRRLSNIKCLAEINRTLSQNAMSSRSNDVDIQDIYPNKTISTENYDNYQSTSKKAKQITKPTVVKYDKPFKRTKSAPNLTSRYAKYFSKLDEEEKRYAREELGYDLQSDSDQNDGSDEEYLDNERLKTLNKTYHVPEYPEVDYYETKSNKSCTKSYTNPLHYSKDKTLYSDRDIDLEKSYTEKFSTKKSEDDKLQYKEFSPTFSKSNYRDSTKNDVDLKNTNDHVVIDREDGSKEVRFTNGNTKIISSDGSYSKFMYYNGDIKETFYKEGTIKYFYKEVNVHHTTYKDGSQLLQFPDGQIERRYPDGSVESQLADGATRWARAGGVQEWKFPDGTVLVVSPQGDRTLRFPNGQVEVHTKEFKRREFPDGTVKVVYADGVVETRFANGRIRVKDKQDRIFLDSAGTNNNISRAHIS